MHIVWNSMLRSRIYQHHPSQKQIWIRNQASGCRCNSSFHSRNKEMRAGRILIVYWMQLYYGYTNGYKWVHFIVQELNSDSSKPSCTNLLSQKKGVHLGNSPTMSCSVHLGSNFLRCIHGIAHILNGRTSDIWWRTNSYNHIVKWNGQAPAHYVTKNLNIRHQTSPLQWARQCTQLKYMT
jgi:hypothetical protein